jgi:hypothetical protein
MEALRVRTSLSRCVRRLMLFEVIFAVPTEGEDGMCLRLYILHVAVHSDSLPYGRSVTAIVVFERMPYRGHSPNM